LDFLLADMDTPLFELALPLVLITVVPTSSSSSLPLPFLDFLAYVRMQVKLELVEGARVSGREATIELDAGQGARCTAALQSVKLARPEVNSTDIIVWD
jgi:hypothetical protein